MPLIINELMTEVETPQASEQPITHAAGVEESERKALESLALAGEREERLRVD